MAMLHETSSPAAGLQSGSGFFNSERPKLKQTNKQRTDLCP